MKKFIYLGFLLIIISVNGQMNIVPPSPNASSIAKFVENEVSLNTGTVNVNVPIYRVTVDDVTLDINLAYNTKGVLVAEDASDVGLGWTLNAGGVITRQVRGIIDERPKSPDFLDGGYLNENYVADYQTNSILRADRVHAEECCNPAFDYFPDLFHLSVLGRSTKIIFDNKTKKPIMQSLNDMKLEVTFSSDNHRISGFILTDEKGNKYHFGTYIDLLFSTQRLHPGPFDPLIERDENYPTAWYLQHIETANKNYISFSYSPSYITTYSKEDFKEENSFAETEIFKTYVRQYSISEISFPQGSITFNKSSSREDLQGGSRLESIEVKNNNVVVKKINLNYQYVTGGSTAQIPSLLLLNDPNSAKRLFLTSVDIQDKNNVKNSSYTFEYEPTLLPSKYSNSIDYWGYFNGFNNGDNMLFNPGSKRREVIFSNLQAGVLKKITYPTGGFSQFEYEPNYTKVPSYWNDLYMPEFKNDSNFFVDVPSVGITKDSYFFVPSSTNPNGVGHYQRDFVIQGNPDEPIIVNINALLGANCTSIETTDCTTKVRIYKIGSNAIIATVTQGTQSISLTPGNYYIKVINSAFTYYDAYEDPNGFENNPFSVILKWKEKKIVPYDFIGGGLRIKSVLNFDGTKNIMKNYTYTDNAGISSGRLIGIPNYFYKTLTMPNNTIEIETQRVGSNKPISNYNAGGTVSYSKVTENITGSSELKGSNVYTFTNYPDLGEFYRSHFPQILPTDLGYLRGIPLEILRKDTNGNLIQKVVNHYRFYDYYDPYFCYTDWNGQQKCENSQYFLTPVNGALNLNTHYHYSKDLIAIPMYVAGLYRNPNEPYIEDPNKYRVSFFTNMFYRKAATEVTDFYDNASVTQKTYYNYDHPVHHQITAQHDILSDFSESLTEFSYAHEKNNQYLIGKNMVAVPLETTVIRKKDSLDTGKVISQSLTKYPATQSEANTKTAGLPLPYEVWSRNLQNNTTLHKELSYDLYDDKGNIQQYTSKDIPVTIIWGYNDTQPIAKIEGALYDQIKTNAFITAIITASNTDASKGTFNSEQALITALDNLRKSVNFSGYQITTYTYDPLVGVRSITPPSGIREVYLYDAANRLKEIREQSDTGKLLKEYKYNYKQ